MQLTSNSFEHMQTMPSRYAFGLLNKQHQFSFGENKNPHLAWKNAPAATQSFALICHDSDSPQLRDKVNQTHEIVDLAIPRGVFYHWGVFNIHGKIRSIGAGELSRAVTPKGKSSSHAARNMRQTLNSFTDWFADDASMAGNYFGYDGPCPPFNDSLIHHYTFTLYALDVASLDLPEHSTCEDLFQTLHGHVLAEASLTGRYTMNPFFSQQTKRLIEPEGCTLAISDLLTDELPDDIESGIDDIVVEEYGAAEIADLLALAERDYAILSSEDPFAMYTLIMGWYILAHQKNAQALPLMVQALELDDDSSALLTEWLANNYGWAAVELILPMVEHPRPERVLDPILPDAITIQAAQLIYHCVEADETVYADALTTLFQLLDHHVHHRDSCSIVLSFILDLHDIQPLTEENLAYIKGFFDEGKTDKEIIGTWDDVLASLNEPSDAEVA
jgi:Raf kinase inhibitor-like YbhB/YbcL family protein